MKPSRLSTFPHFGRSLLLALACLIALATHGCSSSEPGVGSSGTGLGSSGTQQGTITGFGSVIVDGRAYETDAAEVVDDIDPRTPAATSVDALRLGMRVDIEFDQDTRAQRIAARPSVIGRIERVLLDAGGAVDSIVVAHQTVRIRDDGPNPTVFAGFEDVTELLTGQAVRIHGVRNAAGTIDATHITRRVPGEPDIVKVVGDVDRVDSASRFRVGELSVDIGTTTRLLPAGRAPVIGDRVTLIGADGTGAAVAQGGVLTASAVRIDTLPEARLVRLSGLVRLRQPGSDRLLVEGTTVDIRTASFVDASASDLVAGRFVRIEGTFSGGLLQAREIRLLRETPDSIAITGLVGDFLSPASFTVRNTRIDASAAGVVFVNGTAANLDEGVLVEVRGIVARGVLRAQRIELRNTPDSRTRAFTGIVSGLNPTVGNFTLLGAQAALRADTRFGYGNGTDAPRTAFVDGALTRVQGRFEGGVFVVDEATIYRFGEVRRVDVQGLATRVDTAARRLLLNGIEVRWTQQTPIDGDVTRLSDGASVKVEGLMANGVLGATRLTVR